MSLERYFNVEELLTFNRPTFGYIYDVNQLTLVENILLTPNDKSITEGVAEMHLYSFFGDYLRSIYDIAYILPSDGSHTITIDVRKYFQELSITQGAFKVVANLHSDIYGTAFKPSVYVSEISPDRTEVKFKVHTKFNKVSTLNEFRDNLTPLRAQNLLNTLSTNFGQNKVYSIVNIWFDLEQPDTFYVKFLNPIDESIETANTAWFTYPILDSYVDSVILIKQPQEPEYTVLRGPNFDAASGLTNSNATVYKSWDDLLDSDLETSQGIIRKVLSGSQDSVQLNIDYTDFQNFIFYSSAVERLNIFTAKLEQIERYNLELTNLQAISGSGSSIIVQENNTFFRRRENIIDTFDPFENWLYNETTASIFTHDTTGSVTPWPKYISNGKWQVYPVSSSEAQSWLTNLLPTAADYDVQNVNRLYWSVPEHILMDTRNSDYITFVEMVATHFDNIHAYIRGLTDIHNRDEHPQRGTPGELLYQVARSYGWHLQDSRELSSLWLYKLGTDSTGSLVNSENQQILPHEQQTRAIWKRTVNSLPYLLKTKGTARSVKALMNIYGIPQTLLSIKEYGGPNIETFKPTFIEDRFSYALNLQGSEYVTFPRVPLPTSSGSWSGPTRVADTVEFRFITDVTSSVNMNVWSIQNTTTGDIYGNLSLHHSSDAPAYSSSISGSTVYGYLKYTGYYQSGSTFVSSSVSSSLLPLFDDDPWTVRLYTPTYLIDTAKTGSVVIEVASAKDYALGDIVHSSIFEWNGDNYDIATRWGGTSESITQPLQVVLGGSTSSFGGSVNRFTGSLQGYKEYFTTYNDTTFTSHVTNPGAYHTDTPSGSYFDLYRYYPLGLDVQRWDHSTLTQVSSSQPNRTFGIYTTASFTNFTGSQQAQYRPLKEKYYIFAPTVGGQSLRSEKLRIEESELNGSLSPIQRKSKGTYDKSAFDTNRLAIVFSLADHINRDIFNHIGFHDLDYLIAGPRLEFESEYADLRRFRQEYFKKYTQINNINSFLDILSLYDYTFFEQLKQLVPGRANLVAGIMVEPHILERNKVQVSKRPKVENPQWDSVIVYPLNQQGEYSTYETVIESTLDLEISSHYYTGSMEVMYDLDIHSEYYTASIATDWDLHVAHEYYTGSIKTPFKIELTAPSHPTTNTSNTGVAGHVKCIKIAYSGSTAETGSIIDKPLRRKDSPYRRVVYHYSGAGEFRNPYEKERALLTSQSLGLFYSSSLEVAGYQYVEDSVENRKRYLGSKLTGPDFNINSPNTVDGGPVIEIYETNPNLLSVKDDERQGNLVVG